MTLSDVRNYLSINQQASLRDMAVHFGSDPQALRAMLSKWIAKGKVEKLPSGKVCGGCCACDPTALEFYHWKG